MRVRYLKEKALEIVGLHFGLLKLLYKMVKFNKDFVENSLMKFQRRINAARV